jgi:hypothetical protein
MVAEEIVPEVPTVIGEELLPTLLAKFEEVETSKAAGGVTVMPASISVPLMEKEVEPAEADP